MSKIKNITLIFIALTLIIACTKEHPAYEKAYLGMPLQELVSSYSEARKIQSVPDDKGAEVVEYSLPPAGQVKRASYFFQNDLMIGMVIIYGKGADFDYLVNQLTIKNGKPILNKTIDNSRGANWRMPDSYITLLNGIKGTQIKLPIGETDEIKPEETILVIGKRPEV
jgi:hypothetical protein